MWVVVTVDAEYAANYRELYENHWWWRAREKLILSTIGQLGSVAHPASILDVGCGAGLFFERLSELGEVEGVETNRCLITEDNPWKNRIHISNFDSTFQPQKQYSLILMLDVLEHFSNPAACLNRAEELMEPSGRLLITVPAFSCLWTTHDDLNHHVVRFTKKSFLELIAQTNLRVQALQYFFHWTFPVKLLIHYKERCVPKNPVIPRVPSPAVNVMFYHLSLLEQRIFSWTPLPFGSSLLAVCSKH